MNFVNVSNETLKLLKLFTRWLSHHACIERFWKYWDTIKYFLHEADVSEKTKATENLSIMNNVETKAYFLFLEYVLNFFNQFNAYFQASQTRIHVLHSKCLQFLYNICQNFLKAEHLKPFSINITFSLKKNLKSLDEINLGYECEEYFNELKVRKLLLQLFETKLLDVLCDCCRRNSKKVICE